jgi:hypothetical protein
MHRNSPPIAAAQSTGLHARPPYVSAEYLRATLRAEAVRLRLVLVEIELCEIGIRQGYLSANNVFDILERNCAIDFLVEVAPMERRPA